MSTNGKPLLRVENLVKYFPIRKGLFSRVVNHVRAVDGVSFDIYEGETLGLAGESGCGKTTAGRVILRLLPATAGHVIYRDSSDLTRLSQKEMRPYRREMQIIFQDPFSSLNPRMTVRSILGEPLAIHKIAKGREREDRVLELLESVGLSAEHADRYPHEFSGGQRQRIGVARALSVEPKLIIADEPVSALDVSIQAQIINLLGDLREKFGLSYLFIAHDLSLVRHISDRVAIMYLGKIVELAPKDELYEKPLHPYTQALLAAVPRPDPKARKERELLEGDVPSPIDPPTGCRFHTRCPSVMPICKEQEPPLVDHSGHQVACHLHPSSEKGCQ
jgi:oligopeptide transport system ATP-binding protein